MKVSRQERLALGLPHGLMQQLQDASPLRGRGALSLSFSLGMISYLVSHNSDRWQATPFSGFLRSGVPLEPSPLLVEARHRPGHADYPRPVFWASAGWCITSPMLEKSSSPLVTRSHSHLPPLHEHLFLLVVSITFASPAQLSFASASCCIASISLLRLASVHPLDPLT